ncbi:MAG: hypothetical protein ACREE1_12710, partial [Stellaceae bacterium]
GAPAAGPSPQRRTVVIGFVSGVYLWESRAEAEAFYSGPWLNGIRERYGMDPEIRYFDTACITDNALAAVLLPEAAE